MLGSFFHWFYCLPLHWAALLVLAIAAVFLLLRTRFEKYILWRIALGVMLLFWIFAVARLTILGREAGGSSEHYFLPFQSYIDLINGGNIEIIRTNVMNLLLFVPGGVLLVSAIPQKGRNIKTVLLMAALLLAFSFAIETLQYVYSMGRVETDDVIHNFIGGFAGALLALLKPKIKFKMSLK